MEAYCDKQGIAFGSTRFMFDEKRLNPSDTAEQVFFLRALFSEYKAGLENDDLIEAYHEQMGGCC